MSTQTTDLGRDSIGKLLFKLATPAIIAQLVNVLYNIVDRIFIGRLPEGDLAMAGIGVAFPIIMLISATSALIGMGGSPLAAIKMGEQDHDGAEKIMSNALSMLVILSILLMMSLLIFKEPLLLAFGASSQTLVYANDYLGIYILGTLFVQIAIGMNPFINTQGFAKIGMMTVMVGAVINIILDPIFIFGLHLGVKGAAFATITAQFISAIWVIRFLFGKKSTLKIRKEFLIPEPKVVLPIMALGVSPFIMQATESIVLISLNNQLAHYGGDLAVSAMTIISSVNQIIILPLMGLTSGAQPIISYNYGAQQFDRVKKTFILLLIVCLIYTTTMWLGILLVPEVFVNIFNDKPELVAITSRSLRIFFAGIFVFGVQVACQQTFLALGQAKISLVLALLRKMILLVPLIFILPATLKAFMAPLDLVFMAEPVADIIAALTTVICFIIFYRKTFVHSPQE